MIKTFVLFLALSAVVSGKLQHPITRTIDTNYGQVRGIHETSLLTEKSYYSFRGIPYAKPPIGDLRFKAPEPIDPWHPNVVNAYNYRNSCMQPYYPDEIVTGTSEDCLYLNIYVPVRESAADDEKLPVFFYIYGGAFFKNSADDNMYGPDFLIPHDIIIVTMTYRLNIFGHLSLDIPAISGNQALKDQHLALKWIFENIEHFGGDPKRITAGGHSSGGISATYQAMNAMSAPYIANLIAMGSTVVGINGWQYANYLPDMLQRSNTSSIDELLPFIMRAPAEVVLEMANPIEFVLPFGMYWMPVIERPDAIRPFITESPIETYRKQCFSIPTLFTIAQEERFPYIDVQLLKNHTAVDEFLENFDMPLPIRYYDQITQEDKLAFRGLLDEIKEFYFANATTYDEKIYEIINLFSDICFTYPFLEGFKVHRQHTCHDNTHLLLSAFDGAFNILKESYNLTEFPCAGHVDTLPYIFPLKTHLHVYERVLATKETDEFSRLSWEAVEFLSKFIADFVKFGKPSVDFPTMQTNAAPYLKHSRTGQLTVEHESFRGVLEFYDRLTAEGTEILDKILSQRPSQPHKDEL